MRLFIAIELPADVKAALDRAARPLYDAGLPVRWVTPEALHITLKFLGEVDEALVPAIITALESASREHAPFTLALEGIGAFPTLARPRVLWVGVRDGSPAEALQREVETALAALGFPPDDRPFSAHLTLGRVRDGRTRQLAGLAELRLGFDWSASLDVRAVSLMRSHLGRSGARHERIGAAALAGARRPER